jgi:hypothetical protein
MTLESHRHVPAWTQSAVGLAALGAFAALVISSLGTPLQPVLGVLIGLAGLADVFLIVLYARMGKGMVGTRLALVTWWFFRVIARRLPPRVRASWLSYCGPVVVVVVLGGWAFLLLIGHALIKPWLPTGAPALLQSVVGTAVLSLTITYVTQVYTALQQRNTLALKVHLSTAETADAAELLAGLGPGGDLHTGHAALSALADEIALMRESHHLYPVLFFFRFREPYYAVSRLMLVALDTCTLIVTALDDTHNAWLKESATVTLLRRASLRTMVALEDTFLGGAPPHAAAAPDPRDAERWRRRHHAAVQRLRDAGIATTADERDGAERYVQLRASWDRDVRRLAPAMGYGMVTIDPVGSAPESVDARAPFARRTRTFA